MFNRSKSKKLDLYTKKEAKAVAEEIMAFFKKLEKRDGKKFMLSFSAVAAVISRGEDGKPKGCAYVGKGNVFVMEQVAIGAINSIAKNKKESPMVVCAGLAMRSMLE